MGKAENREEKEEDDTSDVMNKGGRTKQATWRRKWKTTKVRERRLFSIPCILRNHW